MPTKVAPSSLVLEPSILSVTEVSQKLKNVVESEFSHIRIQGEVSGLKRHASGHAYFAIKDDKSVMDAVCWRGTKDAVHLQEGLEIVANGKITTYAGRSKYQMVVSALAPSGQGAILQLLQKLKEKLSAEGLFDAQHKKSLPFFPKRIGVITSPTGAVLKDIWHRICERFPTSLILAPVLVQGESAASQVIEAIHTFHALKPLPDVIIIARGGGSLEDLWAFNDEALVRAVFCARIPIISAIGHETDFTLLDFVADKRAPTPTAAAEIATPVRAQIVHSIQTHIKRLDHFLQGYIRHHALKLERFQHVLKDPMQCIFRRQQALDDLSDRLQLGIQRLMAQKRLYAGRCRVPSLEQRITFARNRLKQSAVRYPMLALKVHSRWASHFQNLCHIFETLSFEKTLQRGFCLARDHKGGVITSSADVSDTQPVSLMFHDDIIKVRKLPKIPTQPTLL